MSSSEESDSSAAPQKREVLVLTHSKRKKGHDRKVRRRRTEREHPSRNLAKSKEATFTSREDKRRKEMDKRRKGKQSRGDSESDEAAEEDQAGEEEPEESFDSEKKIKKRKHPTKSSDEEYTSVTEEEVLKLEDMSPKQIKKALRKRDSKFEGVLTDFNLPERAFTALLRGEPPLAPIFEDGAAIPDLTADLADSITATQTGIHYLIAAMGKLAKDPPGAKDQLEVALVMCLQGLSFLHTDLIAKWTGITEEEKQFIELKQHAGRQARHWLDEKFFRQGGGSQGLSASAALHDAAAAGPATYGPTSLAKPQGAFALASSSRELFPIATTGRPPQALALPPSRRLPFPRPRSQRPTKPRPRSFSPPKRAAGRTGSPTRRH
jgi:hypothetical protein